MRILFVNCVCGVGSTGRIVTDLMAHAKNQGNTVRVACSTIEPICGVEPNEVFTIGSKLDYYVHNILSRITDHEGLFSVLETKKLIKRIRKFNPDVVHIHNIHGHWINYEIFFKYLSESNKKVIWTLHDCWSFTGHCSNFSILQCEQWRTHCLYCKGLRNYPKCYGRGDVSRNFDRKRTAFTSIKNLILVTPSNWLADLVKNSFFKNYPVIAIPNGIDLNIFHPIISDFKEKHGISRRKMILGVANVWSERKGFNDVLKLRKMLDDSYSIVLVGLTEKQLEELPDGIIGIHRTANAHELAEIYSAADVFVNPTYEDNFPTVNLEALACGTPVITYQTGGSGEAIDKNSGITVNQGDINGLIDAISRMIELNTKDIIKRGLFFNKNTWYEKYLELYKKDAWK